MRRRWKPSFGLRLLNLAQRWIEGVAQPVAKHVKGQNHKGDGDAREDRDPPCRCDVGAPVSHDIAPRRCWWWYAHTQEAERGFYDDGPSYLQSGKYDDAIQDIGQDMPDNDVGRWRTCHACQGNKATLFPCKGFGPHKP